MKILKRRSARDWRNFGKNVVSTYVFNVFKKGVDLL